MQYIDGGVCAPAGFKASGIHCGIRKNKTKKDLALIISEVECSVASVYTQNLVKGAPIYVTQKNTADGKAQAIICNSGNANTCNSNGIEIAEGICKLVEKYAKIPSKNVVVASTGVIGQLLSLKPFEEGMVRLVEALGNNSDDASEAIMTTDTVKKEIAVEFDLHGQKCRIGGICKGSGMIHPNMATMLAFLTTDVNITAEMLKMALTNAVDKSFNMLSIDGDTSTNDMLTILANGKSGNAVIDCDNDNFKIFCKVLNEVCIILTKKMAKDGEGATKLLECKVSNAKTLETARKVAKSVITSSLLKSAMFGADANWGRVLCAIGYSGADIDITKIDVDFESSAGKIAVCKSGSGIHFNENDAKNILLKDEINIIVNLNDGIYSASAWGCDLTYDYVKINGDYRT